MWNFPALIFRQLHLPYAPGGRTGKEMLYAKRLDAGVGVVIFIARPRLPINPSQCAATLQASIPTI